MIVLYINGARYEAPTVKEVLNNYAQDLKEQNERE